MVLLVARGRKQGHQRSREGAMVLIFKRCSSGWSRLGDVFASAGWRSRTMTTAARAATRKRGSSHGGGHERLPDVEQQSLAVGGARTAG
jgi:hypothetical protein